MKWAIEYAPPMPSQLVPVLTGLAYHADSKGRGAYPSVARLAAYACKSERSVRRDLRDLEELKLIRRGDQSKAAHLSADKRPEVYDLATEVKVPDGRAGSDDRTRASARTLASSRERGRATREAKKASSANGSTPERGDVDVRADADVPPDVDVQAGGRGRPSGGTPTSAEPKNEPTDEQLPKDSSLPPASSAPAEDGPAADHHLEAFGAFWINYPKKKAREEAKKAWINAIGRGADPKHIVDAAQAYARERADEDPKYTKYPATWLNKGCYDDEPEPAGRPPLRAVSGGYEAWRNPEDQSAYYDSL
jgi:helix-turn-helix protein